MKMVCLYGPERDDLIIETIKGPMKYIDYINMEASRIKRNPTRKVQIISRLGWSSLLVDAIATNPTKSLNWTSAMPKGQRRPRTKNC